MKELMEELTLDLLGRAVVAVKDGSLPLNVEVAVQLAVSQLQN